MSGARNRKGSCAAAVRRGGEKYRVLRTKYTVRRACLAAVLISLFGTNLVAQDDTAAISQAPKAFREAVAKVRPSMVRIEGLGGVTRASAGGYPAAGEGPTTGLIVSADGYIVTSTFNFLRKPPVITAVLNDGKRHVAQL